jgi:hypothetical protein
MRDDLASLIFAGVIGSAQVAAGLMLAKLP